MELRKFIPLAKMEEQSDGTLHVFGTVTAEQPDLENEVCDYAKTKPYYEAKAASMLKATSIPGMEPSLMPLREMHQLKAIGAGRSIQFDDAAKCIRMGFNVVEKEAIEKFRKGVLIGFSQGGSYVGEKTEDPSNPGCVRYVADPGEVSAVDSPCLPSALVESMKGRTVTLHKASGATVEVAMEITDPATEIRELRKQFDLFRREFSTDERRKLAEQGKAMPDGSFPIENEEDLKNAIHAYGRAKDKPAAKKHIISRAKSLGLMRLIPEDWTSGSDKVAISRACGTIAAEKALNKGIYAVGELGQLVEDMNFLCIQTEDERDLDADVPEELQEAWKALQGTFQAIAKEEDGAAASGKGANQSMKITDQAGLTKAAKTIHDHLGKLKEHHEKMIAHHERMTEHHKRAEDLHKAHTEHIEKCMKAAKDSMDGDEPDEAEKAAQPDMSKAVEAALAPLTAKIADLEKKLREPVVPAAHTGATGYAEKANAFDALIESPVVQH